MKITMITTYDSDITLTPCIQKQIHKEAFFEGSRAFYIERFDTSRGYSQTQSVP